ncbi:MAG: ABC transporter permease [Devosia sp.]
MGSTPSRGLILLMILPGAGFILFFLASAIGMTIAQSFGLYAVVGQSHFTLDYWIGLFDKTFIDSFLFSLKIGVGSAVGALIFAYPLALFLRKQRPGSGWISAWVKVPLFVPALVAAFLIVNMLAYQGLLNSALLYLHIIDQPLRMLNDKFGWNVFLIQVWKNLPFQLVILTSVLQTIRGDIEDAARNLGAGPIAVIRHIILPLSMPGIMISVALVFILTFGDYAITRVAGPIYPTSLSVLMYTAAFTLHDWATAACIGVVIVVTSLVFVALYARTVRAIESLAQ